MRPLDLEREIPAVVPDQPVLLDDRQDALIDALGKAAELERQTLRLIGVGRDRLPAADGEGTIVRFFGRCGRVGIVEPDFDGSRAAAARMDQIDADLCRAALGERAFEAVQIAEGEIVRLGNADVDQIERRARVFGEAVSKFGGCVRQASLPWPGP